LTRKPGSPTSSLTSPNTPSKNSTNCFLELAYGQRAGQSGGLTMAGISYVFTISRVAEMLGEDEEWLDEISIVLDPEDGRLGVLGVGEESTTAFTRFGIDNLADLVQIYKANPSLLPRPKPRE
jgi:hypothetical protein